MIELHSLLATRAVQKAEYNAWRGPFVFDDCLDAIQVEYMTTTEFDARFCSKARYPTNSAISIFINTLLENVWVV